MKAVTIADPGPHGRAVVTEVPDPLPSAGEVVIRVAASGVNRADVLQRAGRYPSPAGWPPGPGLECAGIVTAVGAGVTRWSEGDAVVGLLGGGGHAEAVACPADLVLPQPPGLTPREAAAVMEAACTAWSALDLANAREGQTVLIHGGSGGVGTLAVQLAAARGLRVVTTAGGADRARRCLALGAELAINHHAEDFVTAVRALGGADVILDVMGAAYLERNLAALAPDGTLVALGLQGGTRAEINLGALLAQRARLVGTTLRGRPHAQRAAIVAAVGAEVWPLLGGAIRPVIAGAMPLSEAHRAFDALAGGGVFGKLVLEP